VLGNRLTLFPPRQITIFGMQSRRAREVVFRVFAHAEAKRYGSFQAGVRGWGGSEGPSSCRKHSSSLRTHCSSGRSRCLLRQRGSKLSSRVERSVGLVALSSSRSVTVRRLTMAATPVHHALDGPPAHSPSPVNKWSVDDVVDWATRHHDLVAEVADRLRAEDVDGAALIELTSEEIKTELKLTLGLRKALQRAIRELEKKRQRDDEEDGAEGGAGARSAPALRKPSTASPASSVPVSTAPAVAGNSISVHIRDIDSCIGASRLGEKILKIDATASLESLKTSIADLKGVPLRDRMDDSTQCDDDDRLQCQECQECRECICKAALAVDGGAPESCACAPGDLPPRFSPHATTCLCRGDLADAAPGSDDNSLSVGQCGCVLHKKCVEGWLRPKMRASHGQSFQIFARAARTVTLIVFPSDTLEDVTVLCQEKLGIPAESMSLTYAGHQMKRGQSLADLNVQKDSTLMLKVTQRAVQGDTDKTLALFQSGSTTCPVCSEHWAFLQLTGAEIGKPAPIRVMFPGQTAPLLINAAESLAASEIKEALQTQRPQEMRSCFLMGRGRPLFDGASVGPGSSLYLCSKAKHEMMVKIHVHQIDSSAQALPVNIATTATCLELKQEVQAVTGKLAGRFALALLTAPEMPLRDAALLNDLLTFHGGVEPHLMMVETAPSNLVLDLATSSHILVSSAKSEQQSLQDWGVVDGAVVYVSWRAADQGEAYAKFKEDGRLATFTATSAWSPSIQQSSRGISMFLSALHVLTEKLSADQESANAVVSFLAALAPFPPAIIGLKLLIDKAAVTEAHQSALSQVLYTIMRSQLPAAVKDGQVFEGSIVSFAWLYQFAKVRKVETLEWETCSLACQLSYDRLVDPVLFASLPGEHFEREVCREYLPGGGRFRPDGPYRALTHKDMAEDAKTSSILLAFPGKDDATLLVTDLSFSREVCLSSKILWTEAQRRVKKVSFFRIIAPASLRNAPRPSLTLDLTGAITVSVTAGGSSSGGELMLFSPLTGRETSTSAVLLAAAVSKLKAPEETCEALELDAEVCDEAIIFVLDKSSSMSGSAGLSDKPDGDMSGASGTPQDDSTIGAILGEEHVLQALHRVRQAEGGATAGASAPISSAQEEFRRLGREVYGELIQLRTHENILDLRGIVEAAEGNEDQSGIITALLHELCNEAATPVHRAEIFRNHTDVFLAELLNTDDGDDGDSTPNDFACPITRSMMAHPVCALDGFSYERAAIEKWLEEHSTSPMTGQAMATTLTPNNNLRSQIAAYTQQRQSAAQMSKPVKKQNNSLSVSCGSNTVQIPMVSDGCLSVQALQTMVEKAIVVAPGRSVSLFLGDLELDKSRTLESYSISSTTTGIRAKLERKQRSMTATVTQKCPFMYGGPIDMEVSMIVHERETIRSMLWRFLRAITTKYKSRLTSSWAQDMVPSVQNAWTGLEDKGDGHRTGIYLSSNLDEAVGEQRQLRFMPASTLKVDLNPGKPTKSKGPEFFSRMLCVKQLFHATVNRTEAYDCAHSVGLVLFGSDVKVACSLTSFLDGFKTSLDKTEAEGDTACYDALLKAAELLGEFAAKQKGPNKPRLRIICFSDGKDTCSEATPWRVAQKLQAENILLDTIMIGERSDDLVRLAKSTNGYGFHATTLKDALKTCELETFVSSSER
jgi:hypothetical protein